MFLLKKWKGGSMEIARGSKTKIVVKRTNFKGKEYIDVRIYFLNDGGEWTPTKKGISIPVEIVGEVSAAIIAEI
jgi:hypothetical protein